MAKGQEAAIARLKADLATCEKQIDLLLDMRLNEQINEPEYVSKKHILVNQKAELKGKLEAFEHNRTNRFEPAIQFVLEAKQATFLLAEGNHEKNRDFLKKIGSNFQMAEKSLSVEFKKPWNLLAEFNSAPITKHVACDEISSKENWRREGDSNALNTALLFRVTDRDSRSQVVTFACICNGFYGFRLPRFSDRS